MERLGVAAVAQAVKMAQLIENGTMQESEALVHEHIDRITEAAIEFTIQFLVTCGTSTPDAAQDLKEMLVYGLDRGVEDSQAFEGAADALLLAAANYANRMAALVDHCVKSGDTPSDVRRDGHEQAHKLASAAVSFTMQLMIVCSDDQTIARESTRELETILIGKLGELYTPPSNLS